MDQHGCKLQIYRHWNGAGQFWNVQWYKCCEWCGWVGIGRICNRIATNWNCNTLHCTNTTIYTATALLCTKYTASAQNTLHSALQCIKYCSMHNVAPNTMLNLASNLHPQRHSCHFFAQLRTFSAFEFVSVLRSVLLSIALHNAHCWQTFPKLDNCNLYGEWSHYIVKYCLMFHWGGLKCFFHDYQTIKMHRVNWINQN